MFARRGPVLSVLVLAIAAQVAVAGMAGRYVLDKTGLKERLEAAMQEQLIRQNEGDVTEEKREQFESLAGTQAETQTEQMRLELDLRPDGSFIVTSAMGGEPTTEEGTWTAEGNTITFTLPAKEGAKDRSPRTRTGLFQDGNIIIKAGEETPFELVLKPE